MSDKHQDIPHNPLDDLQKWGSGLVAEAYSKAQANPVLHAGITFSEGAAREVHDNWKGLAVETGVGAALIATGEALVPVVATAAGITVVEAGLVVTGGALALAAIPLAAYGTYEAYRIAKAEGVGAIPKHLQDTCHSLTTLVGNTMNVEFDGKRHTQQQKALADESLRKLGAGTTVFGAGLIGGPVKEIGTVALNEGVRFGDAVAAKAWQSINGWTWNGLDFAPEYATTYVGKQLASKASGAAESTIRSLATGSTVGSGAGILKMSAHDGNNGGSYGESRGWNGGRERSREMPGRFNPNLSPEVLEKIPIQKRIDDIQSLVKQGRLSDAYKLAEGNFILHKNRFESTCMKADEDMENNFYKIACRLRIAYDEPSQQMNMPRADVLKLIEETRFASDYMPAFKPWPLNVDRETVIDMDRIGALPLKQRVSEIKSLVDSDHVDEAFKLSIMNRARHGVERNHARYWPVGRFTLEQDHQLFNRFSDLEDATLALKVTRRAEASNTVWHDDYVRIMNPERLPSKQLKDKVYQLLNGFSQSF